LLYKYVSEIRLNIQTFDHGSLLLQVWVEECYDGGYIKMFYFIPLL